MAFLHPVDETMPPWRIKQCSIGVRPLSDRRGTRLEFAALPSGVFVPSTSITNFSSEKGTTYLSSRKQLEANHIENMQREDLTPIEEAEGIQRLIDKHGYLHENAARIVDKARNTVTALLKSLTLSEDILAECRSMNIATKTFLVELAGVPEEVQREVWESLKAGRTKTRDAVREARGVKEGKKDSGAIYIKTLRAVKSITKNFQSFSEATLTTEELDTLRAAKSEMDAEFEKLRKLKND